MRKVFGERGLGLLASVLASSLAQITFAPPSPHPLLSVFIPLMEEPDSDHWKAGQRRGDGVHAACRQADLRERVKWADMSTPSLVFQLESHSSFPE